MLTLMVKSSQYVEILVFKILCFLKITFKSIFRVFAIFMCSYYGLHQNGGGGLG